MPNFTITDKYWSLPGVGGAKSILEDVQSPLPTDITILKMFYKADSVSIPAAETVTIRFNINGTTNLTFGLVINSGVSTGTVLNASGSLILAQGDLVCYEFVPSAGAASFLLTGLKQVITLAYNQLVVV